MTPQEAAIRLREWYQAFKNFGKGNERTVKELLEAANLIESLAAELEDMTTRYKIADGCAKKKGEMNEKLYAELATVKAERDAMMEYVHGSCPMCKHYASSIKEEPCASCYSASGHNDNWEWRGVQKEE